MPAPVQDVYNKISLCFHLAKYVMKDETHL